MNRETLEHLMNPQNYGKLIVRFFDGFKALLTIL